MHYDDQPETAEAPDPRVDMMREFVDIDKAIKHRERAVEEEQKQLSELRSKRESLRNKIQQSVAPENAVAADFAITGDLPDVSEAIRRRSGRGGF